MDDGSIRVKVKIDKSGVSGDLKDVDRLCENTAEHIKEMSQGMSSTNASKYSIGNEKSLNKTLDRLRQIDSELKGIYSNTDEMLPMASTDEQAANLLELEKTQTAKLLEEQTKLNSAVEDYKNKTAQATAEKQKQTTIKGVNQDASMAASDTAFMSKINTVEQYNAALEQTKAKMAAIEAETARVAAAKGINPTEALAANTEYQKLNSRLNTLTSSTKKFGTASKSSFKAAQKGAESVGGSIKKGIKQMLRYTLAIFGARSAFMFVKQSMQQYISDNEELSNSIQNMKGVIGEMLGPAVEYIVNILKYALAYLNAFIKALSGVDFVARYNTKQLKKQAKATKENTKAQKDYNKAQLASFDTLNKLADTSSTSDTQEESAENQYSTLSLPEVDSNALMDKLRSPLAMAIGLLAGAALVVLGILACCAGLWQLGIGLIVAGAGVLAATVMINWGNIGRNVKEIFEKAKPVFAGIGLIVLGILACCAGLWPLGISLIITGASVMTGETELSWTGIREKLVSVFDKVAQIFAGIALVVLGVLICCTGIGFPLGVALIGRGANAITGEEPINWDAIGEKISKVFDDIINIVSGIGLIVVGLILCCTGIGIPAGAALISRGIKALTGEQKIDKNALLNFLKSVWAGIKKWWDNVIAPVLTAKSWADRFSAIKDGFKYVINGVLSHIESAINWVIKKINGLSLPIPEKWRKAFDGATSIGFNLPTIQLPRLAKGGIVNNPGAGVAATIGEAGSEAVLPLEHNTEWMDMLAEKIASMLPSGNTTIKATGSMSQLIRLLRLEIEKDKKVSTAWG